MSKRNTISKVITLGEVLADFVPEGANHILRPGGAPANVAVNLCRMGTQSSIIAKVGDGFLGEFLVSFLNDNKVNTSNISKIKNYKTGMVFVFLKKKGERDFSFYGHPSADTMLEPRDVKERVIKSCAVFHFGSISMMAKKSKSATLKGLEYAKKHNKIISYDPNVRFNLWEHKHMQAKKLISRYFKFADIVKISDTELKFLFGKKPVQKDILSIFRKNQLVFVSCGAKGCVANLGNIFISSKGVRVKAVDTTGAGDAFMAGVIHKVVSIAKGLDLNKRELIRVADFANKKASKSVTRKGAV